MTHRNPLSPASVFTACDPESLDFDTTESLPDIDATEVQTRAAEAIEFGIGIGNQGYNLFALGPAGIGKFTTVRDAVSDAARQQEVPGDWCYVHNFVEPDKPTAISLPPGRGGSLRRDMRGFVEQLNAAIPAALDNDDTHARLEQIEEEFRQRRNTALGELRQRSAEQGIAMLETPAGFTFVPTRNGNDLMTPEQFQQLSETERSALQRAMEGLQDTLQKLLRQFQGWRKEAVESVRALHREIAEMAVGHLVDDLRKDYGDLDPVVAYLDAVQEDVVENVNDFMPQSEMPIALAAARPAPHERYDINMMVDNSRLQGAPVVHEPLPNVGNLIGRCEHRATMGTLVTNFTLIKPGALHRANGGYLLLDARQLLIQPYAWETLKRALKAGQITIESLERALSLVSTVGLEPQPISLNVKVVLVGDRTLYYLLRWYDPEYAELFKVAADFEPDIGRDADSMNAYARLIATMGRQQGGRPLERDAVARIIEQASRLASDAGKLSTHLRGLSDLIVESDHVAGRRGAAIVSRADVQGALDARERRLDRIRQRALENIHKGTILIATEGQATGQVNGLAVMEMGDFAFGHPVRITATTRLGEGQVVDIERETELGGPIHSKGVMILSSFLMARYARAHPVSLAGSIVFEQSYSEIEGDSASLAELAALVSSLATVPLKQSMAITGSMNQHGQAQPIGGVNEKIEGFFDVCRLRGLDGSHGVIIPRSNVGDLMLRPDVVKAVAEQRFCVYAVDTADQALELLTGIQAGERDAEGAYPPDSVNARVDAALVAMAKLRREHDHPAEEGGQTPENRHD